MKKNPLVSIVIVDYKVNNPYLRECLEAIEAQTYKNFEIVVVHDRKINLHYPKLRLKSLGQYVGPAEKRDIGAKMAKGEIVVFVDDDTYSDKNWLKNLITHFSDTNVVGVGGPGITPPNVSWQEAASGWASASPVGAGPYTYRFLPDKKRYIDDYPSMNLAVRRSDFLKVGGFDSNFFPGEDTKLCLDLTHKLGKKIIYEPKAIVYHHRRPIWKGHLRQNGNFGLHRGYFARILPETSLRLVYFLPSLLLLGLLFLIVTTPIHQPVLNSLKTLGCLFFSSYLVILFWNAYWIYSKSRSLLQSLISIPVIFTTHLWYGTRFLQGFLFTTKLTR